ncbi:MAG: O-antigen ligase family protein [Patescibacteria group bacterium]|nr:O-antigen ligase family protein [Patescibacteria group bacterium]
MQRYVPYLLSAFMVIDFILGEPLGWFRDPFVASLYLGIALLLFLVRPWWGMVALVMVQVLDTVSIFGARVYQWATIFLVIALVFRALSAHQFSYKAFYAFLKKNKFFVSLLCLLIFSSSLGLINASVPAHSLKQTMVLLGSVLIAFLVHWWIKRKKNGAKQIILAFIFSSIPVSLFAIYQNVAHEHGWESFETMVARPNVAFYEPDWLGMYLVLVLALLLPQAVKKMSQKMQIGVWLLILLNTTVLIISVARASWLAAIAGWGIFAGWGLLAFIFKKINRQESVRILTVVFGYVVTVGIALILIGGLKLTRFDLKDRFQSIYQGEHLITIAKKDNPYEKRKIDLEEIEHYEQLGYQISEEKISDENIESRYQAYASNWEMGQEHWLLGQGQGATLAQRGFVHNANNIFYEWWIAGGILGIVSFLLLLGGGLKEPFSNYCRPGDHSLSEKLEKSLSGLNAFSNQVIILMGISGIVITNLFNSGIFFTPLWVFIGIIYGITNKGDNKKQNLL